jgi:hypothetical protein
LIFNIRRTVFGGKGVVQNVEVRFLKGTASVREAIKLPKCTLESVGEL